MSRNILFAVSGGIAAYKACDAVSKLRQAGCEVRVIMTKHAAELVAPATFEALTGNKVYTDTFDFSDDASIKHIVLAQQADVFVAAPATANLIAKLAHGIADDMVTSTYLAATCPAVVCPSMHANMYANTATQENLKTLERRGVMLVGPTEGRLASGDVGRGPLAPVNEIIDAVLKQLETAE
jgi:phosphopantothenoylcysteine decarboxylase/phosphopantothenate--cysteine ligase